MVIFHSYVSLPEGIQLGPSSNFIDRFLFNGSRISGGVGNHKPAWEAPKKSLEKNPLTHFLNNPFKKSLRNPYWKSAHPESRTHP